MSSEAQRSRHLHQVGERDALKTLRTTYVEARQAARVQHDFLSVSLWRDAISALDAQVLKLGQRMEDSDLCGALEMSRRGATL